MSKSPKVTDPLGDVHYIFTEEWLLEHMVRRRFMSPVILPSVWQLEGKESYLEWILEQDKKIDDDNTVEITFLIIVGIVVVYLLMLVI